MVHVWSINSGERFQGHHGPLVFFPPQIHHICITDLPVADHLISPCNIKKRSIIETTIKSGLFKHKRISTDCCRNPILKNIIQDEYVPDTLPKVNIEEFPGN